MTAELDHKVLKILKSKFLQLNCAKRFQKINHSVKLIHFLRFNLQKKRPRTYGQVSLPQIAKFIKSNKNCRILVDEKNFECRIKDNKGSTTYWIQNLLDLQPTGFVENILNVKRRLNPMYWRPKSMLQRSLRNILNLK